MWDPEPFYFFRALLFVFLSIYFVLAVWSGVQRIIRLLRGDDPRKRLLRAVVAYQLASIRPGPLVPEAAQIGVLIVMLVSIWWAHTRIGAA